MQQPNYSISTPENVDLHLELAGVGNRVLASLIDTLITYGLLLAVGGILAGVGFFFGLFDPESDSRNLVISVVSMIGILLTFAIVFGYYILFEGLWHGQTPGKKIVSIRVIDANGQPVGWGGVVLRNLIRTFDTGFAFIGLIPMIVDKNEKRFGDYAAGTIVIRERKPDLLKQEIKLSQTYQVDAVDVGRLNPQEYALIVEFLKRREKLAAPQRAIIAEDLSKFLQNKLSDTSTEPAENYVERVYSAYKARAEG